MRPVGPAREGRTAGVPRRFKRPAAAEPTAIATHTSRQPGTPITASATSPETTRPPLVPVLITASTRGRWGATTTAAARSEYAAHTHPAALPASTVPTASTAGDGATAARSPPTTPHTLPTVVGARGPRRRLTTGASSRPAR